MKPNMKSVVTMWYELFCGLCIDIEKCKCWLPDLCTCVCQVTITVNEFQNFNKLHDWKSHIVNYFIKKILRKSEKKMRHDIVIWPLPSTLDPHLMSFFEDDMSPFHLWSYNILWFHTIVYSSLSYIKAWQYASIDKCPAEIRRQKICR
jgi:hypothetical protein